ncbi:hypothetical protein [uncultured Phenylobacterium sp.]|uniref:hypothetical protein n=1 Tax=uncultured Phenylobacterium sp. TaxID=349273 RepID=UPI0025E9852A|nr:hypothetical protein [uncultured Phenylobacterium sp.]
MEAALTAARADFTQHAIWHATNTAPAMRAGNPAVKMLVESDITCLGAYAETVAETLYRLGRAAETPALLERLRPLIDDPRWPRKVLYLQAQSLYMATDDRAEARREFAKLVPLTPKEADVDILRLGIGLLADELSMTKALRLCDRVLELTEDLDDQLRFRALKAVRYPTHGVMRTRQSRNWRRRWRWRSATRTPSWIPSPSGF